MGSLGLCQFFSWCKSKKVPGDRTRLGRWDSVHVASTEILSLMLHSLAVPDIPLNHTHLLTYLLQKPADCWWIPPPLLPSVKAASNSGHLTFLDCRIHQHKAHIGLGHKSYHFLNQQNLNHHQGCVPATF